MIGGTALQGLARACAAAMPFAVAIAIGAVMLALTGHDPVSVYRLMIEEAFGGERRIAATLTEATPLLLMGLAAAVAFRAGVFNVGAEGCFYVGGIVAAVAGYSLPSWPSLLLIPFALAAASVVGGAWLLAPGLLRARLGVDEVVTTLMLNFIAIDLTSWLVDGPLLARGSANSATPLISAAAELPRLLPPATLHFGFLISLALVAGYGVLEPIFSRGFALPTRRAQSPLQPRRRHRAAKGISRRDDRVWRHRRTRRRHPHPGPRTPFRRRASRRAMDLPESRSRSSPAIPRQGWWSRPSCSERCLRPARTFSSSVMSRSRSSRSCRAR